MKSTNSAIENFLIREGLKSFTDPETFWSWAQKRVGSTVIEQYKFLLEQRSIGSELGKGIFYDFISTSNLSIIANSFEYDLIKNILQWIEPKIPKKGIILELGCHTGLLSRYYALARPDAHIIGIDISESAIANAKEFAEQKRINNLTYFQADVLKAMELSLPPVDCIISGRILSELMTAQFRHQISWDKIIYPPIDELLDADARMALVFCTQKISPTGTLLMTERLSNYDRFNRAWLLTQKTGFIPQKSSITPISWTDVAGKHKTWFFENRKSIEAKCSVKSLDLEEIPICSNSTEVVNDESRLLFNGYLAYQTWLALDHSKISQKVRLILPGGGVEVIEQGKTGSDLGYVFIGNTMGNYLLTLYLNFEIKSVKADIDEYINQLLRDGAKIKGK